MTLEKKKGFTGSPVADQLLAGVCAGGISTSLLHPLDLIKTQFQVNTLNTTPATGLYTLQHLRNIRKLFGWKGLYQGFSANMAGSTASWGIYFLWYHLMKRIVSENETRDIKPSGYFVASGISGK